MHGNDLLSHQRWRFLREKLVLKVRDIYEHKGHLKEGWKILFLGEAIWIKNECCEMLELTIHDLIEEIKLFI